MSIAPIVNLNGSSARDLCDQQRAVADAAHELITALCNATPHGRDFQLSDTGTYTAARDEHAALIKAAQDIRTHAVDIAMNVIDQGRD